MMCSFWLMNYEICNYPMITLRNKKAMVPVCKVKNKQSFLSVSWKLTTLGLIFVENKDEIKIKIG